MAFPPEFQYANEDDFTQRFVIPLLQRLGFFLVVNYHGAREHGKDLIVGEIDRIGHVRYHGLQAKYEPSISLNGVQSLVLDCHQAFATPFTHPRTGAVERISTFYAVNGGSLGPEAVDHYFNSLRPHFGGNVQLLQGKDLLTLDHWASANRVSLIAEQVTGMLVEIRYNRKMLLHISGALTQNIHQPLERLRIDAVSSYLTRPTLSNKLSIDNISEYLHGASACNKTLDFMLMPLTQNRGELTSLILNRLYPAIEMLSDKIEASLAAALHVLGPLTGA